MKTGLIIAALTVGVTAPAVAQSASPAEPKKDERIPLEQRKVEADKQRMNKAGKDLGTERWKIDQECE